MWLQAINDALPPRAKAVQAKLAADINSERAKLDLPPIEMPKACMAN